MHCSTHNEDGIIIISVAEKKCFPKSKEMQYNRKFYVEIGSFRNHYGAFDTASIRNPVLTVIVKLHESL